jgi:lipopolysaccharide transport system permease protein
MAWFLASLGVYLRDVAHTIGIVLMVLMYLSPIFYQIEIIKDPFIRDLIRLNPVTIPVEQTREALLFGRWPDWPLVVVHGMASLLVACAGFWWFQRTKRGFADVL